MEELIKLYFGFDHLIYITIFLIGLYRKRFNKEIYIKNFLYLTMWGALLSNLAVPLLGMVAGYPAFISLAALVAGGVINVKQ